MTADAKKLLESVASWPEEDQQELAEVAREIEARRKRVRSGQGRLVPMDDDTSAMFAYAKSPEGRTRIEIARQELREGKGIYVLPRHFDDLRSRISERVARLRSIQA